MKSTSTPAHAALPQRRPSAWLAPLAPYISIARPDHWFKIEQVLQAEAKARAEGVPVTFDMFPYTAAATTPTTSS